MDNSYPWPVVPVVGVKRGMKKMKTKTALRLRKVVFAIGSHGFDGFGQKVKWSPRGGFGL
jgi:hypothetical protein